MDIGSFATSLKLAFFVTSILLIVCLPIAYWRVRSRKPIALVVESLVSLPMVLPPTVLGFYLLWFLSPMQGVGKTLFELFHIRLVFSFPGLVLAGCLAGLPFMFQPLVSGLMRMDRSTIEASYTLGKGRWETFLRIVMPGIRPAIVSGTILTFMHSLGEFGLVLMIGGSLAGQTKTISIELYEKIEAFEFDGAFFWAGGLLAMSFVSIVVINLLSRDTKRVSC
jgi:molybdate transport system permease protein